MIARSLRVPVALVTTLAAVGALAGCSSTASGGDSSAESGTYTWWDPYPQHEEGSDWANRVQACGDAAGVTIQRTAYDTTALTNQALLAAQENNSPDVILLDNPAVSTLAETGMVSTVDELGLDVSSIDENLLAAGELDGKTYGIPVGANTLALYYNADVLAAAGVDPASITDWASLDAALAKVSSTGKRGITFSALNTEEGSFQFLPWFWGAGAELTQLDSPEAIEALTLWKGWVDGGYAPNSVITNSQNTVWEEFLTGEFAFAENGTWQVNSAAEAPFKTGVITLPAKNGGAAAAPTGGEFIIAPVQQDTARYDITRQIIECMTTPEGFVETANTFAYYIPPTAEGQEALLEEHPDLETWVSAVQAAKGRTSDNLGTKYPVISEQLWTAVQSALSGAATPEAALEAAQTAAAAETGK
ncbi:sugar ABC transporter substrate-binding protein [Microbacterium enclense]|uniref:Multiple sugar transport system substrate-binding protein n=1 Tax=Microbacterium enclense TaxID=993073 RepID=A0A1G6IX12_9MICO|nr:extracellular solute-binding protein [Microbacterium enclense]KSU54672.1 ABC transporter substrate-binding protein [Microbacterium enclense]SDC10316.1 multiple sugar transport system substrate-binding protein [Microbacterium enclense]